MKARSVNEVFKRGQNPHEKLNIGKYDNDYDWENAKAGDLIESIENIKYTDPNKSGMGSYTFFEDDINIVPSGTIFVAEDDHGGITWLPVNEYDEWKDEDEYTITLTNEFVHRWNKTYIKKFRKLR